nr:cation/H(+) antiporter 14 [Tanacetum cinerariifolium]
MVVCIHNEDNVPLIINLLEASNPSKKQRIEVITINLHQLKGQASAILISSSKIEKIPSAQSQVLHIGKAFKYFMERYNNSVMMEHFFATTPYHSMHEDIFTIAINKYDKEALVYNCRIAQHHHISFLLILLRLKHTDVELTPEVYEKRLDTEMVDRFRMESYRLSEWSQCPELGGIGDLLATSEFTFSVLVVQ